MNRNIFSSGLTRALVHALRTPVRRDFVARRQDGTRFDVEIALSLASPQDPSLTVCIIRDITVRKQVAEQLCAALGEERALRELKSRFIAVVSPEFRNPLSVIRTSTAILRDYSDHLKDDERARHFAKIETQVEHMLALLEDVLAIEGGQVKGSKLERTPTNLVMLCQEVVEGCQITTGTDHPIICRYPETGLDRVELDPKLIRQLMTNLVSNAIKYSRDQGSIYVDLTVNEEAVELRVQDEGIGIPEEDQQHLFQAFHRATNAGGVPGTGLGLLVAQNAAELRGGTIQLESRVGVGTTITVTIPLTHGVPITCRPA